MKIIIYLFRSILVILVCLLLILIFNWSFQLLFNWVPNLWTFPTILKNKWWSIWVRIPYTLLIGGFSAGLWNLFKLAAIEFISFPIFYLTPRKKFGFWVMIVFFLINCGYILYSLWSSKESYTGWEIFIHVIGTIAVIEFTYSLFAKGILLGDI